MRLQINLIGLIPTPCLLNDGPSLVKITPPPTWAHGQLDYKSTATEDCFESYCLFERKERAVVYA